MSWGEIIVGEGREVSGERWVNFILFYFLFLFLSNHFLVIYLWIIFFLTCIYIFYNYFYLFIYFHYYYFFRPLYLVLIAIFLSQTRCLSLKIVSFSSLSSKINYYSLSIYKRFVLIFELLSWLIRKIIVARMGWNWSWNCEGNYTKRKS